MEIYDGETQSGRRLRLRVDSFPDDAFLEVV